MSIMVAGLVLFLGIHLIPVVRPLRARLAIGFGDRAYRGLFALVAALGLVLIIYGYHSRPDRVQLFEPSAAARAFAPFLVTLAFVLFAAANMKTHIRAWLRHPMLIGLTLWSGVHLFANGDKAGTILFGSFFAYALVALVYAKRRDAFRLEIPAWKYDAMAVGGGVLLAYVTIRFHPSLFGTAPVG
jgi:uncharacterized membrane protein